jgi:DNA-binding PadR family transcriptional regulator
MEDRSVTARRATSVNREDVTAMRSPIYWTVLGLVIERPSYGYELARRFEHTYGSLLPLSGVSHIYAALETLVGRELIVELDSASFTRRSARRQPRPHYRATDLGVESYRAWLVAQRQESTRRSQLFARQLVVFRREPQIALDILARYERACRTDIADDSPDGYASADPSISGPDSTGGPGDARVGLASQLSREEHRLASVARLSWIEYARAQFTALAAAQAGR